jgi:outer membrane receptor protein involved in Fe transport
VTQTPKLALLGGAFLFDERVDGPVLITLYPAVQRRPHATIDTSAWAVFSQAMYHMSPRVAFSGGIRYSDESKDLANTGGTYRIGTTALDNSSTFYQFVDHVTYNAWTPKVSIQLVATSDVFVYASASRGFKSGGFNPSWPKPDRPYNPELAWSYEGGLKSTVAGGRDAGGVRACPRACGGRAPPPQVGDRRLRSEPRQPGVCNGNLDCPDTRNRWPPRRAAAVGYAGHGTPLKAKD